MEFFIQNYATVEKVVDGVAIVTVRIPEEMLDDVLALTDHIIHTTRFIKMRARTKNPQYVGAFPPRFKKVIG